MNQIQKDEYCGSWYDDLHHLSQTMDDQIQNSCEAYSPRMVVMMLNYVDCVLHMLHHVSDWHPHHHYEMTDVSQMMGEMNQMIYAHHQMMDGHQTICVHHQMMAYCQNEERDQKKKNLSVMDDPQYYQNEDVMAYVMLGMLIQMDTQFLPMGQKIGLVRCVFQMHQNVGDYR